MAVTIKPISTSLSFFVRCCPALLDCIVVYCTKYLVVPIHPSPRRSRAHSNPWSQCVWRKTIFFRLSWIRGTLSMDWFSFCFATEQTSHRISTCRIFFSSCCLSKSGNHKKKNRLFSPTFFFLFSPALCQLYRRPRSIDFKWGKPKKIKQGRLSGSLLQACLSEGCLPQILVCNW